MNAVDNTVYLDHNATTRPVPEAVAAMVQVLQSGWANPSSTHGPGQDARRLLAAARARVAAFLGCSPAEVVFTSGATEANHMALLGAVKATGRDRVVMSAVEHPGMQAMAQRLRADGVKVDLIPVDAQGRLSLTGARALIASDVALVCVMGANNETGVLMPMAEVAEMAHAAGTWMHVDATQMAGKAPLSFAASGADLMSVSAHKLGGPKGVGALLVRKGVQIPPLLCGRQERNRRGGTENIPGIAGFAAACDRAAATLQADIERMGTLRRRLEDGLAAALPQVHVYGHEAQRLCNTLCLRFGTLDAEQVLGKLERAGIVASSGAACSAGGTQPSHVLLALGESPLHAKAGVRLSLGPDTTEAEVDATIAAAIEHLQPLLAETLVADPA